MIATTVNMCWAHDVVLCELCSCYNEIHEGNLDYSTESLPKSGVWSVVYVHTQSAQHAHGLHAHTHSTHTCPILSACCQYKYCPHIISKPNSCIMSAIVLHAVQQAAPCARVVHAQYCG